MTPEAELKQGAELDRRTADCLRANSESWQDGHAERQHVRSWELWCGRQLVSGFLKV